MAFHARHGPLRNNERATESSGNSKRLNYIIKQINAQSLDQSIEISEMMLASDRIFGNPSLMIEIEEVVAS